MKTYKEMAKSVFYRRKEYMEARSRRREAVKVWSVCVLFALILSGVGSVLLIQGSRPEDIVLLTNPYEGSAGMKESIPGPSDATESAKISGVELCLLDTYTKKEEPLREGIRFPLNMYFEIDDLRGLTDEEKSEIKREKIQKQKMIYSEIGDRVIPSVSVSGDKNTYVAFYSIGGFTLNIEEYDAIDCVTLKGSNDGQVGVFFAKEGRGYHTFREHGIEITSERLSYNFSDYKYGVSLYWSPSYPIYDRICDNPEMDLSEIQDSMQIIVWYVNGDVDVYTIDIFFDQEGTCYAMMAEERIEQ